jgi:hypothetical protein
MPSLPGIPLEAAQLQELHPSLHAAHPLLHRGVGEPDLTELLLTCNMMRAGSG